MQLRAILENILFIGNSSEFESGRLKGSPDAMPSKENGAWNENPSHL
jgi:hypothetical protein